MNTRSNAGSVGVEEEFVVVDPATGGLRPKADEVLPGARSSGDGDVHEEFRLSQLETATEVCWTLADVRRDVMRLRRRLIEAAAAAGYRVAATGTHPFSHWSEDRVTPKDAYLAMERDYQQLSREKTVCGCHVHVGMPDADATIQVMNRVRPWLPVLLSLSCNSPFWTGFDTGYHSFRMIVAHRTPLSGIPDVLACYDDYQRLVERLIGTGLIDDASRIMWDVRPSPRFPTLEIRVSDVCLTVEEAVMVAGLARGLARTCLAECDDGAAVPDVDSQVLRAASWQAARYGLSEELIDAVDARPVPARQLVARLLEAARPGLEDAGDWDEIRELVEQTLARGTGADRQRQAFVRNGRLEEVVDLILAETAAGAA